MENPVSCPSTILDVVVLGAGASGLFCAAACGRRGRSVLVLDHGPRTASKVRISGGGRCNFTNVNVSADHYRSLNPHFCRSALARFTPADFLAYVRSHRLAYYEKEEGGLFCSTSSKAILALLEGECRSAGVDVRLNCGFRSVTRDAGRFTIAVDGAELHAASVVVATGGLSYPGLGASGIGFDLARQFGLSVVEPRPALVPFVLAEKDRRSFGPLAGVSLFCSARCGAKTFYGNLLFTHKGLSGPAMLQASLEWKQGMPLRIDLVPETDILGVLMARRRSKIELKNVLAEHLPRRIGRAWCDSYAPSRPLNRISDRDLKKIAHMLHAWEVVPSGTEGYATAEVTAGGVDTDELSSRTMETKKVPGLYFIGEVVDVTGELGGYNLHWAWASAHAAGAYA